MSAANLAAARERVTALEHEVAAFQSLPTLRLRDAVLKAPVVGVMLRASARQLARLLNHNH